MRYFAFVALFLIASLPIVGQENGRTKSNERGADAKRPNILLITSDDLGLQLSCYGDTVIETPNLDALAASGVQFDVAYVAQASCSPSRSAMFTGLYPHANGQYGLTATTTALHAHLHDATLPNILKRAGYRTGMACPRNLVQGYEGRDWV